LDASTAARTINQVIATPNADITRDANEVPIPHKFISINHHNIVLPSEAILSSFIFVITVTKTVDMLTAKHISAGENIIGIKFSNLKYSKNFHPFTLSQISLNAEIKTINGDRIIAIRNIQILIINTTATTIKGIQIATRYQKVKKVFNSFTKVQPVFPEGKILSHECIKDEYNVVNTPTYALPFKRSCNLLVAHQLVVPSFRVHSLFLSNHHLSPGAYTPFHKLPPTHHV
jgi:hypothetical protein